jgi:hypothetical protein
VAASAAVVSAAAAWSTSVAPPVASIPVATSWPPDVARLVNIVGRSLTYV